MLACASVAASVNANDWGNVAIISDTLGNHAGRLCVGEGLRVSDIGCPTYAPSVTTAGDVSVTGNLSANKFIGDGSLLTGIGQGDRLVSGSLAVVANSETSYVSLSTASTTWGYFSSGASYLPHLTATRVSSTNISTTLLQFGASAVACTNGISGTIRWSAPSGTIQVCDGAGWVSLASGTTGGAGVSALASLTDVQITNIAGRDYLRYDNAISKWVNISESAVMSTTTMVSGWPDALRCTTADDGPVIVYLNTGPHIANGRYYYAEPTSSGSNYYIVFNADGSYNTQATRDYTNCKTSISAIAAAGRAFNFIGNAASSGGGGALGDRITSGTLAMVANSATSIVSLSTNGTVWGYLGNAASYLPTLTANRVSATSISSTLIQMVDISAACTSGMSGSIRFNTVSDTVQVCTSNGWKSLVSNTAAALGAAECRVCITETTNDGNTSCSAYSSMDTLQETVDAYYANNGGNGASNIFSTFKIGLQCRGGTISGSSAMGDRITSGTLAVVANSATSIVSLSTNGTVWGYLGSAASYLPSVRAANISASSAIQVGTNSLTCTSGISGTIRYSQVSSTMEYCNSTAWVSLGPSDTTVPAFSVTKDSAQSLATLGTVVTWESAITNYGGSFNLATERFVAPVSGYYFFIASLLTNNDAPTGDFHIHKNGASTGLRAFGTSGGTGFKPAVAQGILYLAAGDYVDVRSNSNSQSLYGSPGTSVSTFSGFLLNAGSDSGGGGSADNLGNHTATQNLAMGAYNVVGTGQVSVTDISVTHLQLKSPATLACNSGALGTIRFNPTTGAPQICVQR
jgi:hypothetical protein